VIRRNEFVLPHLPAAFDGFTLLQASDLHLDYSSDLTDALITALGKAGDYDACVLTGISG